MNRTFKKHLGFLLVLTLLVLGGYGIVQLVTDGNIFPAKTSEVKSQGTDDSLLAENHSLKEEICNLQMALSNDADIIARITLYDYDGYNELPFPTGQQPCIKAAFEQHPWLLEALFEVTDWAGNTLGFPWLTSSYRKENPADFESKFSHLLDELTITDYGRVFVGDNWLPIDIEEVYDGATQNVMTIFGIQGF